MQGSKNWKPRGRPPPPGGPPIIKAAAAYSRWIRRQPPQARSLLALLGAAASSKRTRRQAPQAARSAWGTLSSDEPTLLSASSAPLVFDICQYPTLHSATPSPPPLPVPSALRSPLLYLAPSYDSITFLRLNLSSHFPTLQILNYPMLL